MLARLRARLTYANVTATLSLFLALGGTSYALTVTRRTVRDNWLTGRDIRTGSLTSSDVRNRSLLAADFGAGQLPRGEKGDKGDPGERGPAGATNAVVRFGPQGHGDCFENYAGEYETAGLATCHAGERATGGGVRAPEHDDAVVIATGPTPTHRDAHRLDGGGPLHGPGRLGGDPRPDRLGRVRVAVSACAPASASPTSPPRWGCSLPWEARATP